MTIPQVAQVPGSPPPTDTHDYLIDMIAELSRLARRGGEPEIAIYLKAILEASRAAEQRRLA